MTPLSRMVQSVYPFHAHVYEKPSVVGLGKQWVKETDSVPAPERLNILCKLVWDVVRSTGQVVRVLWKDPY